ncbi:hypothetical protein AB0J09_55125, partial [Nonomuraea sp. NPDC049784]
MHFWLAATLIAGMLTSPALVPDFVPARDRPPHPGGPGSAARASGRQADFAAAAREYGVPESVLLGVSYLESRWDTNGGSPSTAGGYGPMHLVDALPAARIDPGDALGDARGDDARPRSRTVTAAPPLSAMRMADPP